MCQLGANNLGPLSYPQLSVTGAGAYLPEQEALWPRPERPSLIGSLAGHSRGHMAPTGSQASVWGKAGLWRVALGQERYTGPHLANGPPGLRAEGGAKGGKAKACPRPCGHSIPLGLFAQQQLASRNSLAGRCLHLLAPGCQAVEQAGTREKGVHELGQLEEEGHGGFADIELLI